MPRPTHKIRSSDPASANDNAVVDWMFEDFAYILKQKLLTFDGVLNGETGITLGGATSLGRSADSFARMVERDPNDASDLSLFPCAASPINPARPAKPTTAADRHRPFAFLRRVEQL